MYDYPTHCVYVNTTSQRVNVISILFFNVVRHVYAFTHNMGKGVSGNIINVVLCFSFKIVL